MILRSLRRQQVKTRLQSTSFYTAFPGTNSRVIMNDMFKTVTLKPGPFKTARTLAILLSGAMLTFAVQPALALVPEPSLREKLLARKIQAPLPSASLIFDLPVTYNKRVSFWINHFQVSGKIWFRGWLEKSTRYMPFIQKELKNEGLPQDLAYMVMIESGFNPFAKSSANAVGPWQFIQPTGERYGLQVSWWLDERRDLKKATRAAIRYMRDLYSEFGSWYLVAASYNMGENGLRRQIQKHKTKDYWELARAGALPQETMDYVPKILAAMLIAKVPSLYGFREIAQLDPLDYELVMVRRGTDLNQLADHLGITRKAMKDLNAEVILGYIPNQVEKHPVRVPRGSVHLVSSFLQTRAP